MNVERLAAVAIFSGVPKRDLERLAQWTDEVSVPAGYELAREGQFAHEFFVIESGTAEVVQGGSRTGPGSKERAAQAAGRSAKRHLGCASRGAGSYLLGSGIESGRHPCSRAWRRSRSTTLG